MRTECKVETQSECFLAESQILPSLYSFTPMLNFCGNAEREHNLAD